MWMHGHDWFIYRHLRSWLIHCDFKWLCWGFFHSSLCWTLILSVYCMYVFFHFTLAPEHHFNSTICTCGNFLRNSKETYQHFKGLISGSSYSGISCGFHLQIGGFLWIKAFSEQNTRSDIVSRRIPIIT